MLCVCECFLRIHFFGGVVSATLACPRHSLGFMGSNARLDHRAARGSRQFWVHLTSSPAHPCDLCASFFILGRCSLSGMMCQDGEGTFFVSCSCCTMQFGPCIALSKAHCLGSSPSSGCLFGVPECTLPSIAGFPVPDGWFRAPFDSGLFVWCPLVARQVGGGFVRSPGPLPRRSSIC